MAPGGDDLDARQAKNNDLDGKPSRPIPAWQLREQMKRGGPTRIPSNHPPRTIPSSKPKAKPEGEDSLDTKQKPTRRSFGRPSEDDPSLPPAFRAAFKAQRKKSQDDFMNLTSVHTTKTHSSIPQSPATTGKTAGLDDSDSDSSFDGHDSFASLGSDDDDEDEAYREGRNQIARQEIESQQSSSSKSKSLLKSKDFRKRGGMNGVGGAPLDFIAE
jgi:hypothetical protein